MRLKSKGESERTCCFVMSSDPDRRASGHRVTEETCNAIYIVGHENLDRIDGDYPGSAW